VTLTFDSATGFLTSVKDPLLQTTTITPDGLGRTRKVTAPDASVLAMTPDEGGLLMSLTPPGKSAHQFTYDDKGRPKTYVPPAGSDVSATTETTAYTKDGLFVSLTSPGVMTSAVSVTYEPEPTSKKRLSRVDYPDKHIDVAYDDSVAGSPRLKSLTSSNGEVLTLGWTGSVLTSLQSGPTTAQHTVSWPSTGFDSALRPTQEQLDAGNTITTGFDNDGFPLSTSDGSWTLTHTRAPSGLVASASFTRAGSTPLNETFGHEASFGEPNDYQFTVGNAVNPLYRVEILARDALGRIRLRRETVAGTPVIRQYDYDAQGRLKTESSCSGVTVTMMGTTCTSPSPIGSGWSYDDNGNRDPQSKGGPNKYDGQDRLTDVGSSTHYTYTTDGRLQTKVDGTGTTSYGYDVAGSLQSVGVTGKLVEYKVDALGRRVERKLNGVVTARWVYGRGLGPVAEFNAAGVLVARYVYARGRNVPDWAITAGGVYRFITDERGSVRLVVRSDGVVVRRQDYDVWGVMTKQNPPPPDGGAPPLTFGFAGGLYDDDTKLVRFGARDYDAQLGRWTSKDPLRLGGGDTNFYKYAGSDPVNNSDPSGLIVSLCSDPAQLPGTYVTGARHNWLMTDAYQGGQVSDDGWFIGTKISTREHTNRNMGPSAMCTPIEHVDEQCVNRMLGSDISSGWWLWDNTCRDVAEAIVQVCTLPGYPDASTTMPVHDVPSRLFQDARKYGFINDSVCENQFPFSEFP
jgi:RHS repeat-associated protein